MSAVIADSRATKGKMTLSNHNFGFLDLHTSNISMTCVSTSYFNDGYDTLWKGRKANKMNM